MKMNKVGFPSVIKLLCAVVLAVLAGTPPPAARAQPNPCPQCPPCTNCPPFTNPPPVFIPGLKLSLPLVTNGTISTTLAESDTNSAYDLFQRLQLQTNAAWKLAASGGVGETNYAVPQPPTNSAFLIAAESIDSDFDGLPDAFETLVLHTNPLLADSDADGVPDGDEDADANGVPNRAEYARLTRALIYTVGPTATEGGGAGVFDVLLPNPAPTNGTTITLRLGGTANYGSDYLLSTGLGYVTNELVFGAGWYYNRVYVTAVNDTIQSPYPRHLSISLESSPNYALDPTPVKISLAENDLPLVAVFAEDAMAAEQASGVATNQGRFLFRRYGDLSAPLLLWFNFSGSAQIGLDYPDYGVAITIAAGSDRVALDLLPNLDTYPEGDEDVILNLIPSPFQVYNLHPLHTSARVVIKDDDLPAVSIVAVDGTAAEYGSDTGLIRLQRTGSLSSPLTVALGISGTASNGLDYVAVTNAVTFPVNSSLIDITVQSISNAVEEAVETAIFTIKPGFHYTIASTNPATVLIDDASNTRLILTPVAQASVYTVSPAIEAPAVFDITRRGRSALATNVPFAMYTNTASGLQATTFFRATGDVSGQNVAFAPYATRARLNLTIPTPGRQLGNQSVLLQVPSISPTNHEIKFLPEWSHVRLEVLTTNAIEGTSTHARLRLSRLLAGDPVTATFLISGNAVGPADPLFADHNLPSPFSLTLGTGVSSIETNIIAAADGYLEGWETMIIRPASASTSASYSPVAPLLVQMREDVADPSTLPGTDTDLDGVPDFWELANGLDPLDPNDADQDADGDGLSNVDEYQTSLNPRSADSDGDGLADSREIFAQLERPADFVPVRLYVRDMGKVNNGMNCAVCHTTQLKVGDNTLFSRFSSDQRPAEQTFWYEKGNSYPICLTELVASLPPTTNTVGNPTTTATYTAGLVSGTNTPPAFVVLDPNHKLGTNKPWADFPNPAGLVGTLVVPRIDLTWEEVPGNAPIEDNPGVNGGKRVFPDQLSPTDMENRRYVILRVSTTPAAPGQPIRLKSFDVDDPIAFDQDIDRLIDPNDLNIAPAGDDNRGTPKPGVLSTNLLTLDVFGRASTLFEVTLQPGDNFRVAALLDTEGAAAHLDLLQVQNEPLFYYVTADNKQVSDFAGSVSPMLTVWRKLHLEFDSMAAPPSSGPEALHDAATVWRVSPNYPTAGRSGLGLTLNRVVNGLNLYEGGKLEIPGVASYRILKSTARSHIGGQKSSIGIEIDAVAPTNLVGLAANLFDDDDRFLTNDPPAYPSILDLTSPPLPMTSLSNDRTTNLIAGIKSQFGFAYILPLDANALNWNAQRTIPFKRHAAPSLSGGYYDAGNQELNRTDRSAFWAYTVVFGYQRGASDDGDPNDEALFLGETIKKTPISANGYSVLFLETIRDRIFADEQPIAFSSPGEVVRLRRQYLGMIANVLAHEVGHAPGNQGENGDHAENDLMKSGPPDNTGIDAAGNPILNFTPATIRRFRSATQWAE